MKNIIDTVDKELSIQELEQRYNQLLQDYAELQAVNEELKTVANITDQKETEEALRISNERFVYATKATFDAIWDWDIINDHLYWGEGYEKIFGYKISSKVENHIHSFYNIHPEDRKAVFDNINEVIAGEGLNWMGEYRYKKTTGEYVPVQDKAIIIRDETGKAVRMIGAMQDISERKDAEGALRKSQERFNSLVHTIDGIVWEADAKTFGFTYISRHAEKLLGYPEEQWINERGFWANHIHPDDRSRVVDLCAGYIRVKKEYRIEYRMIAANGKIVWLADFVSVVSEKNKPVKLRGIMVDITARKKTEAELREKNSQLKELSKHLQNVREEERRYLAREVHDELGQLAAVVKMDIDWLQIKMPGNDEAHQKRIAHASATTNLLITTIRKLASQLRPGMLDELGLNASLESECAKFTDANGIPCVFESTIDDSRLGTQVKTELFRICQESLSNALRHANATQITVNMNEGSGTIEMHITDNGKGFDTTAKTKNHGLVVMKERSFSINGILKIASEIGKGTVVSIIIPKSN